MGWKKEKSKFSPSTVSGTDFWNQEKELRTRNPHPVTCFTAKTLRRKFADLPKDYQRQSGRQVRRFADSQMRTKRRLTLAEGHVPRIPYLAPRTSHPRIGRNYDLCIPFFSSRNSIGVNTEKSSFSRGLVQPQILLLLRHYGNTLSTEYRRLHLFYGEGA